MKIENKEKKHLVCVYGTLKKNKHNNYLLTTDNNKFLGEYKTEPKFTMYSAGGFPILKPSGNTSINTEVYEVTDQTLDRLYALEGYSGVRGSINNWYDTMDVETPFGKAMIFVQDKDLNNLQIIETGNW